HLWPERPDVEIQVHTAEFRLVITPTGAKLIQRCRTESVGLGQGRAGFLITIHTGTVGRWILGGSYTQRIGNAPGENSKKAILARNVVVDPQVPCPDARLLANR